MEQDGKIEITVSGDNIDFNTNMTLMEMNFWLDYVKYLIVSGQAKPEE